MQVRLILYSGIQVRQRRFRQGKDRAFGVRQLAGAYSGRTGQSFYLRGVVVMFFIQLNTVVYS